MLITFGVVMLFIAGIVLYSILKRSWDGEMLGAIALVIGITALVIWLLCFPLSKVCSVDMVIERDALQTTYDHARKNGSEYELVAITQSIADFNADLARAKYWAKSPWTNWFYVAEILNVEPIR